MEKVLVITHDNSIALILKDFDNNVLKTEYQPKKNKKGKRLKDWER